MLTSGIGVLLGCAGYLVYDFREDRTSIIAMTAHAMVGDSDRFLSAGMDGYVSKPIQASILRAEIDRLTQSKITNEGERMTKETVTNDTAANDTNPSAASKVNLSELLTRVDNDRELLCDLLLIFKEEFPGYLASLEKAVVRKDAAQIASLGHTLKGMLSNLAVARASASAARLEKLAQAGDTASLGDAYAAFEQDVHGLLPEMETYMAEARA
jgi:HPt (histidine-containing phosphotransfer) domain-containing protein